jgi:hypothetical protein
VLTPLDSRRFHTFCGSTKRCAAGSRSLREVLVVSPLLLAAVDRVNA